MRRIIALFLLLALLIFFTIPFWTKARAVEEESTHPTTKSTHSNIKLHVVKESFQAKVTAYNSVPGQTDGTPCIAANGSDICELLRRDDQTCAANGIEFGQRLYVADFGTCTVRDRLSAEKQFGHIDLYFGGRDKIQAARNWGVQTKEIFVLE